MTNFVFFTKKLLHFQLFLVVTIMSNDRHYKESPIKIYAIKKLSTVKLVLKIAIGRQ